MLAIRVIYAVLIILGLSVLMASHPALAEVITETVEYEYAGATMRGVLAYEGTISAKGKLPGVVVVHEYYGLNENAINSAKRLAAMGYVALAADMYGNGIVAKDSQEASTLAGKVRGDRKLMRGRALAALQTLQKNESVEMEKVFAIGYCFGGTAVLEMARAGAPLLGVASFHGGLSSPMAGMGLFKGEVLALHGAADPNVPPAEVEAFKKELADAGVEWTFVSFGKAVHSFTNPQADSESARYNKRADIQSWWYMKVFFDQILEKAETFQVLEGQETVPKTE